jgi:uncharacterized membrane protein YciS (DUF1049 family)
MGHLKIILGILIGLFIIVLAVQNNDTLNKTVNLRLNPLVAQEMKSGEVSLYQLVLVSFLVGVLGTGIHGMVERFRLKRRIRNLTRELQDKDKELSSLRNLPLTYDSPGPIQGDGT